MSLVKVYLNQIEGGAGWVGGGGGGGGDGAIFDEGGGKRACPPFFCASTRLTFDLLASLTELLIASFSLATPRATHLSPQRPTIRMRSWLRGCCCVMSLLSRR